MMATLATTEEVAVVGATGDEAEVPSAVEAEKPAARANVPPGFKNEETNEEEDNQERSTDDEDGKYINHLLNEINNVV